MEQQIGENEIGLAEIYITLAESKKTIIIFALLGGLLAGVLTISFKPRLYESSCLMRLGVVLDRPIEPMDRLIEVLKEPNTLFSIAQKLELDIKEESFVENFRDKLFFANRAGLFEIKACENNAKESVRYVNAIAQFVLDRHSVLFERYRELYHTQLNDILNLYKANSLNIDARTFPLITEATEIVVPPVVPQLPLKRHISKNIGVGLGTGILAGIVWAFLRKGLRLVGSVK